MLKDISGGHCMIVGRKDEILLHNPHLVVLDGTGTETENDTESQYKGSGYVILFVGRLLREKVISSSLWGKDRTSVVMECKTNIIKGKSSHHGSSGN